MHRQFSRDTEAAMAIAMGLLAFTDDPQSLAPAIASVQQAGYCVHQESSRAQSPNGARFWWTCYSQEHRRVEVAEGDFATEKEAWKDAVLTHFLESRAAETERLLQAVSNRHAA